MEYLIEIDEQQRAALEQLVREHGRSIPELEFWADMLAELPKTEAELPKVVHGFCL